MIASHCPVLSMINQAYLSNNGAQCTFFLLEPWASFLAANSSCNTREWSIDVDGGGTGNGSGRSGAAFTLVLNLRSRQGKRPRSSLPARASWARPCVGTRKEDAPEPAGLADKGREGQEADEDMVGQEASHMMPEVAWAEQESGRNTEEAQAATAAIAGATDPPPLPAGPLPPQTLQILAHLEALLGAQADDLPLLLGPCLLSTSDWDWLASGLQHTLAKDYIVFAAIVSCVLGRNVLRNQQVLVPPSITLPLDHDPLILCP